MVFLNFFLWVFISNMFFFSTVETGSFCLVSVHFSLAGLLVLWGCLSFGWCFAFPFPLRWCPIGNVILALFLWCLCLVAGVLASAFAFVDSSFVHSSVCYGGSNSKDKRIY